MKFIDFWRTLEVLQCVTHDGLSERRGEEQNREEGEMAQKKLEEGEIEGKSREEGEKET